MAATPKKIIEALKHKQTLYIKIIKQKMSSFWEIPM